MNQQIFAFLKKYGTNTETVNRLITTAFVHNNPIVVKKNKLIKNLLISKESAEYKTVHDFLEILKKYEHTNEFNTEALVELFEFVISPSDKVINGAVYTPSHIRQFITKNAFDFYTAKSGDLHHAKIADIACGCGGFLLDASRWLHEHEKKSYKEIYRQNIYGADIQKYSIDRTEILLSLLALEYGEDEEEFEFNLKDANSLKLDWRAHDKTIKANNGFDIILGNPPYVCSRNMDAKTKELISNLKVCSTGHPDLYIPFFKIGYELLAENGILGYITVNTFIKSLNGRALRRYFREEEVDLRIVDFEGEQVFKARHTYTCIAFLSKAKSKHIKYSIETQASIKDGKKIEYEKIEYEKLDDQQGWKLKDCELASKCETTGTPLGKIFTTKSGIATLKNSVYIFKSIKEDKDYFYITDEIKIEKGICKNIINSNLLANQPHIEHLIEKIIFPYFYTQDSIFPQVIREEQLEHEFPYAYKYLLANKEILAERDKGKGREYTCWYAFGRSQSLEKAKYKLLFPQLAKKGFNTCLSEDENLYFYNGMAALSSNKEELIKLQEVFSSSVFWRYIESTSKHYNSGYFSLGRNYIKNFGINLQKQDKKITHTMLSKNQIVDKSQKTFVESRHPLTPLPSF